MHMFPSQVVKLFYWDTTEVVSGITESQNSWGWKGSLKVIWSKPPAQVESPVAGCSGSRWVLNISKEGDSTTSLGNLCQCSVTFTVKKHFLMFRGNLLGFSLCPLPLVLSIKQAVCNNLQWSKQMEANLCISFWCPTEVCSTGQSLAKPVVCFRERKIWVLQFMLNHAQHCQSLVDAGFGTGHVFNSKDVKYYI